MNLFVTQKSLTWMYGYIMSHIICVTNFLKVYSLLIEEDGHASRNISIQFLCVCVCLSLLWSLQFLVRVFTFLSLNLWFSYFGTFLSTWSILFSSKRSKSYAAAGVHGAMNCDQRFYLSMAVTPALVWVPTLWLLVPSVTLVVV